jgi:hypothetical protein
MTTTTTTAMFDILSDEEFKDLVDEAVRGQLDPNTMAALKDGSVANRTYTVLVGMKKNVEGQLAARKADYGRARKNPDKKKLDEIDDTWLSWRAGAIRFKSGVESLMLEVRDKRTPNDWSLRAERNELANAYENLRKGIIAHRDHLCDEACDVSCSADDLLWSLVA